MFPGFGFPACGCSKREVKGLLVSVSVCEGAGARHCPGQMWFSKIGMYPCEAPALAAFLTRRVTSLVKVWLFPRD